MIKEVFKTLYNDGFILEKKKTSLIFFFRSKTFVLRYDYDPQKFISFTSK